MKTKHIIKREALILKQIIKKRLNFLKRTKNKNKIKEFNNNNNVLLNYQIKINVKPFFSTLFKNLFRSFVVIFEQIYLYKIEDSKQTKKYR